jgi:transcriptional regulator with XRE-family HTH domain
MFGQLLAALRREHTDEQGHHWTQRQLAQSANMSEVAIGKIERGERVVRADELAALADALKLTTNERIEFYLAAVSGNQHLVQISQNASVVLESMITRMEGVRLPAFILDAYCDVLAANAMTLCLFNLTPNQIASMQHAAPIQTNMLRFVFSPEFDYRPVMRERWHGYLFRNMMNFRTMTLRYRATTYFSYLFHELNKWSLFQEYWQMTKLEMHDYFTDYEEIFLYTPHPYGQHLAFFSSSFRALTSYGELYFCTYIPQNIETHRAFEWITEQCGTKIYYFGYWPDKPI